MSKSVLFLIFIGFHLIGSGQDSLLNYLTATDHNHESIIIKWEIKSGNTCNGIEIQRSTDSVHYEIIEYIAGVCGNNSSPTPYQTEDLNPAPNTFNYYRIKLGTGEPTRPAGVFFIKLNTDGYFLFPNPAEQECKIYFQNENHEDATFILVNSSGQILYEESVNGEVISLNLSDIPSGSLFFSIEINGRIIKGKLIKN